MVILKTKLWKVICITAILISITGMVFSANLKPYQIKWYFIGNGQQPDVKKIEAAVNKYIKGKINATVKLQCYSWGDEYNNRMQMIISSGEPFDICFTSSWANLYRQNVAKGAFLDITDLVTKYAPNTWNQLHPSFKSGSAIDGRNYAIPANKELAHQWGLVFNKKLVDKYKFDLSKVKKLSDIEPMLAIIKDKEPGVVPFQNVGSETAERILDFDRIGDDGIPGCLYNDSTDMKVFNEIETDLSKEYYKLVHKWFLAGYISKDAVNTSYDWLNERKSGKAFCWSDSLKPFAAEERSQSYGIPVVQVDFAKPIVQTRDCTGSMQAISRTSKDPARALMFLELFNTDPYLNNLINFGIEGVHYVKKGGNVIGEITGQNAQNSGYKPGTPWMFGNQYINYFWEGENTQKWDAFRKFNADSTAAKSLGFNFDNEPVKTEISAIYNIYREMMPGLNTGVADPDVELPKVLAKFKAAGLDKVIAEKQKQLNEWLAKNK